MGHEAHTAGFCGVCRLAVTFAPACLLINSKAPETAQEAISPFDTGVAPDRALIRGAGEDGEQPGGVRTKPVDDVLGLDHVVLRLGHLLHATQGDRQAIFDRCRADRTAFFIVLNRYFAGVEPSSATGLRLAVITFPQQHALSEQILEWFTEVHQSLVAHRPCPEPGVE
ncbi:hypothetical protein D3C80_1274330 [compost metagenome]